MRLQLSHSMTDLSNIITQLEQQRTAIDSALAALRNIGGQAPAPVPTPARGPGRPKGSGAKKAAAPAESQPKATRKRRLSAEGRKRIIEAAKRRWAMKRANEGGQGGGAKKAAKKASKKAASAE